MCSAKSRDLSFTATIGCRVTSPESHTDDIALSFSHHRRDEIPPLAFRRSETAPSLVRSQTLDLQCVELGLIGSIANPPRTRKTSLGNRTIPLPFYNRVKKRRRNSAVPKRNREPSFCDTTILTRSSSTWLMLPLAVPVSAPSRALHCATIASGQMSL
jgi:hypothetical protein